ncbi:MAG: XRE family transcriptional regulator, partial [Firmicutes bacterium]|nr:XRE family transcriptional regulator [Bacillota bacterium]
MNTITVKNIPTPYGYDENYPVMDGIPITEWFEKYKHNSESLTKDNLLGLYPAWGDKLEFGGEKLFIQTLLYSEGLEVLPVLICPDDLDLSCIVLVSYIHKDKDFVYWDKIGQVTHKNEEKDMKYGISYLEAYIDEDWE